MQKFIQSFNESMKELKNIKVLCVLGMLGALSIILYRFSFTFMNVMQIGFDPVCNLLASCLFGPAVGAVFGGSMDLLNFILNNASGSAYVPGMTLNAVISGIVIGLIFYKRKLTPGKMIIVFFIDHILLNALLGTYWLYLFFPTYAITMFPGRLISNIVKPFLETFIILTIHKALTKGGVLQMLRQPLGHKK